VNGADETIGRSIAAGLGDTTAVLCGDRTLSYQVLDRLACQFGNGFRALGVDRGDRIVIVLKDTPELVAAYLGAMKVGAVPVAFSTRASAADIDYVIEDSGCQLLMIEPERAAEITAQCRAVTDPMAFATDQPDQIASEDLSSDDPAFWFYTSGTTGQPKAVVHCQRTIPVADLHLKESLGVGPGDRIFTTSKMFFAFALCHSLLGALRLGATMILHEDWPDASDIAAVVDRFRPTLFFCVPTLYRNLLQAGLADSEAFRGVRHFVSAGEKLPATLLNEWQAATGSSILEGIGTSETACLFIASTPGNVLPGATGKPLPWADVRLVDDGGVPVTTPDTLGYLQLRMGSLFSEYWDQPELTAAAFHDGWNKTGDMFEFNSGGYWFHHGRGDDMMKISGQWVSPSQIEDCVRACPEVADAAAVGISGPDGLVEPVVFVIPVDLAAQVEERVQDAVRRDLPGYKRPRKVVIVDDIPRTATGKVQRFKLREHFE
jgi:3-hydroxybenzoate/4-hydroxybenzoate---CoA ligase